MLRHIPPMNLHHTYRTLHETCMKLLCSPSNCTHVHISSLLFGGEYAHIMFVVHTFLLQASRPLAHVLRKESFGIWRDFCGLRYPGRSANKNLWFPSLFLQNSQQNPKKIPIFYRGPGSLVWFCPSIIIVGPAKILYEPLAWLQLTAWNFSRILAGSDLRIHAMKKRPLKNYSW